MAHSHGCWREASVPHQQPFPESCLSVLMTWQVASPSMQDPSDNKEGGVMPSVTYFLKSQTNTPTIVQFFKVSR